VVWVLLGRQIDYPSVVTVLLIAAVAGVIAHVPAGLGVLDSGLAGALVLYGYSPAASVGAVLVYHAIAVWVPGLGGLIAWLPTRARRLADAAADPAAAIP